jgi:HK97 family phage major capsid protein
MLTVEDVKKSIAEAADAMKAAHADNEAKVKSLVEETIKSVLQNHPGFTPQRTVEFPDNMPTQKDEILRSMPKEVQFEADKILILSHLLNRKAQDLKSWAGFTRKAGDFKKAMDVATAGEGLEWVPSELSPELQGLVRLQLKVAALFPNIQMPTNPYSVPVQLGRARSYKHSEQTADTGQTKLTKTTGAGLTGKTTFTAVPHAVELLVSDELTEDSVVPMMPWIQSEIVTALAEGREDAILNGDTNGTHEDSDVTGADDRRKLFLGLRALSHDNSYTQDMSTLSFENSLGMRGAMGKYGVSPANLAWVTGIAGYMKLLKVDGVVTLDKYGAGATILQGELAKFGGIPVIVSEFVREDLDTTGLYNASGTATALYLVYRNGFAIGEKSRGEVKILRELYAESAQIALLTRERIDFEPVYPVSTNKTLYLGVNV